MMDLIDSGAAFSADRVYRYRLWRRWADGPVLMVIACNPSTADETTNDPTVRRCINYARLWGFSGLRMMNLFAYRATDPKNMRRFAGNPVGEESATCGNLNRFYIEAAARSTLDEGGAILAAWGAHGAYRNEGAAAVAYLTKNCQVVGAEHGVACLGLTKDGAPRHPLYVASATRPVAFIGDGGRLCP